MLELVPDSGGARKALQCGDLSMKRACMLMAPRKSDAKEPLEGFALNKDL